jgi:hypothetical protein
VDQPSVEVDGREVDNDVVVPLPTMAWSTAASLLSFIKLKLQNKALQEKRTKETMIYSIYKRTRELGSQRTNSSPTKQIYNIYKAWQPSLVLGSLGRARCWSL